MLGQLSNMGMQAGQIQTTVSNASGVPPVPAAPSEDTASIESIGEPEPVTELDPVPPSPPVNTSKGAFGVFLPVTETTPAA